MLKGGIIIEVINVVQAQLAEAAGFTAVSIHEWGTLVAQQKGYQPRGCDPRTARMVINSVLIPVLSRVRVGHITEAKMAQAMGVNIIDESNDLGSLTYTQYIRKKGDLSAPIICDVANLDECIARLGEGASMLRTRKTPFPPSRNLTTMATVKGIKNQLMALKTDAAKEEKFLKLFSDTDAVKKTIEEGNIPFPLYAYGSINTPNDVAMMMHMGCAGVFIANNAFAADNPRRRLEALATAVRSHGDIDKMVELSIGTHLR
ncbi:hypothetical protein GGH92_009011 [Coemansia sp. RSA 2673]|nr:hypothetical protein GGH92_009011 [Coemansia sp. RSA 2673]